MTEKKKDILQDEEVTDVSCDDLVEASDDEIIQQAEKINRKFKTWQIVVAVVLAVVLASFVYKFAILEEPAVAVEEAPAVEEEPPVDFDALLAENPETKAWLTIPGAGVDHVVVQDDKIPTSNSDYKYLHYDFYGNSSEDGTLFFEPTDIVGEPIEGDDNYYSQNLIIFGHNMKDGAMFGQLTEYEDPAFYEANPEIYLETVDGKSTYEIFAVCELAISPTEDDPEPFYYIQPDFATQDDFMEYIEKCKSRSLYDIPVEVEPGDEILTLSTCSDYEDNNRFVIFAVKVEE